MTFLSEQQKAAETASSGFYSAWCSIGQ